MLQIQPGNGSLCYNDSLLVIGPYICYLAHSWIWKVASILLTNTQKRKRKLTKNNEFPEQVEKFISMQICNNRILGSLVVPASLPNQRRFLVFFFASLNIFKLAVGIIISRTRVVLVISENGMHSSGIVRDGLALCPVKPEGCWRKGTKRGNTRLLHRVWT